MQPAFITYNGPTLSDATPDQLRKRAKQIEKTAKAEKRRQRALAERRQIAIDALVRVASDPKKGLASVHAAQALLDLDSAK